MKANFCKLLDVIIFQKIYFYFKAHPQAVQSDYIQIENPVHFKL